MVGPHQVPRVGVGDENDPADGLYLFVQLQR